MSYTEIYAFGQDGNAYLYKEIPNSFMGAMEVWHILEERYLPQYRPSYIPDDIPDSQIESYCGYKPTRCSAVFDNNAMKEIWGLYESDKISEIDKIVLATTFDKTVIARKDLPYVIQCFNDFDEIKGETTIKDQAKILQEMYDEGKIIAVGWNQTSVNSDTWECFKYDEEEDEHIPYNILTGDYHHFLFKNGLGDFGEEVEHNYRLFNEMLDMMDFDLFYSKGCKEFRLEDRQGGNLGKIESDRFNNIIDIIDRLDVYINDYIVNDIREQLKIEEPFKNLEELYEIVDKKSDGEKEKNKFTIELIKLIIEAPTYKYFTNNMVALKKLNYTETK